MNTVNDEDWNRLARHLAGEQTVTNRGSDAAWLAEHPELVMESREVWDATEPDARAAVASRRAMNDKTGAAWLQLTNAMQTHTGPRHWWEQHRWIGVGLVASLFAIVPVVLRWRAPASPAWTTYTTGTQQHSTVYIAGGIRAELRANSVLRVSNAPQSNRGRKQGEAIGMSKQTVELKGEAIFTVTHDSLRTFEVIAGTAVAEDLGTVFTVRAYDDESAVRVVVVEGMVGLRQRDGDADASSVHLLPGDVGTVDHHVVSMKHSDEVEHFLAWRHDRLVFRRAPLRDVLAELGHTFQQTIELLDTSLGDELVTLDMPAASLATTLSAINALLGTESLARGDTTWLTRRPRSQTP